jgi:hypothetical protein
MSVAASITHRSQAAPNRSPSTTSGRRPQTAGAEASASCGMEWQSNRIAWPKVARLCSSSAASRA